MKNLFLNSHGGWSRIADPIWSPATQIFFIQTSPLHWSIRNLWGDLIYKPYGKAEWSKFLLLPDSIWNPATQKLFNCLYSNISIEASKISGDVLLTLFTNLMAKQNGVNFCCWLMLDCCQTQFEAQPPRNLWPEPPSLKPLSSSPSLLKGLKLMLFWNSNNLNLLNNQQINPSKLKE